MGLPNLQGYKTISKNKIKFSPVFQLNNNTIIHIYKSNVIFTKTMLLDNIVFTKIVKTTLSNKST